MLKSKSFSNNLMGKFQRFGGAMYTPVSLFSFAGIMVGVSSIFTNPNIMGNLANEITVWFKLCTMILEASWLVFRHAPLLFAVALPIGLARKQNARACMESLVLYLTFNYFMNSILTFWGPQFGVVFKDGAIGITRVAGILTLDMGIIGGLLVAGIVVWLHNRFFDAKLPEFLGTFKGSVFVYLIGFFVLIPVAFLCAFVWPKVQGGINSMQQFLISTGVFGVGIYGFLERLLIPTGLHHFINIPFMQGDAAINGGILANWARSLEMFSKSTVPLKTLFPAGGFALFSNTKIFGSIGIALALYATAKPHKKETVLSLLIPTTLTAVLCGITEPLEFTFLFIAPVLFFVHAVLAGLMQAVMYAFGIVGAMNDGLIGMVTLNWIPLFQSHGSVYLKQIIIGLVFVGVYFILFKFLITKLNFKTPGREDETESTKLYSKNDYVKRKKSKSDGKVMSEEQKVESFVKSLGGVKNIVELTNCATRIRLMVADPALVQNETEFKNAGAHGLMLNGKSVQIVVGLSAPTIREIFENHIDVENIETDTQTLKGEEKL